MNVAGALPKDGFFVSELGSYVLFFLFVCFLDLVSESIGSALFLSIHFQMGTFESAILTKYISFHEHCTLLLHSACSNKTIKLLTVSVVSVKKQGLNVGGKGAVCFGI